MYIFCPRTQSVLGGFLDPLADKIMVATVALALGREGIIPEPLVVKRTCFPLSPLSDGCFCFSAIVFPQT